MYMYMYMYMCMYMYMYMYLSIYLVGTVDRSSSPLTRHVWIFGAPPESAKRAYAGCGSRLNSCYKSLKNENTLPWKDWPFLNAYCGKTTAD